jgi:hypothetical protein
MPAFPGVHFVGSLPLPSSEDVFRTLSERFGSDLRRLPDGETGDRQMWVVYQARMLASHPQFEDAGPVADWRRPEATQFRRYQPKPGVRPADIDFVNLGYADVALKSWSTFQRLKASGIIGQGTRFLVALPTPYSVMSWGIEPSRRADVEGPYARAMRSEIDRLCARIPAEQLAIQWDAAHDMQAYEGARAAWFTPAREGIIDRLVDIAHFVPQQVQLGYHLCFGAFGGRHYVEPKDAGTMVEVTRALLSRAPRQVDWMHLPIPAGWKTETFYRPLAGLAPPASTEIYLGLVHHSDGPQASCERASLARKYLTGFGIAAECGFGREPTENVPRILNAHAETLRRCC